MTSCPFSKFRNIFGKENAGVHSVRFMNVAIIDYLMTIILAFFITYTTSFPIELSTIACFITAIIMHTLFGVKTTTTTFLNLACN